MRLNESTIRRIIKEEAKRVMREGDEDDDIPEMDAEGIIERYMIDIKDLFKGGYDPDDAMSEAEMMIDDMCEHLRDHMNKQTEKFIDDTRTKSFNEIMDYLREDQMDRSEYERDMEEDR
jgi:predicted transcriptional regulator